MKIQLYGSGIFFTYRQKKIENGLMERETVFLQLRKNLFKKESVYYDALYLKSFTILFVCFGYYRDWE